MITLTPNDLEPFTGPLTPAQRDRAEAWLPVLAIALNARYVITSVTRPAFVSAAADSVMRRLSHPGQVSQQTIGPATVRFNERAALLRWFLPEQLDDLDAITGSGNVRTVILTTGTPLA